MSVYPGFRRNLIKFYHKLPVPSDMLGTTIVYCC